MRVPNISTYFNSTHRLGKLTSDLESANEKAATQKRINEISDDPLGLSQVLTLTHTLGNLDQIMRNVAMGKSWLQTIESSLDSVNDLMLEVKTDIARLANDSTTADERRDSIERIDGIIHQLVALGNTQVNGSYVFGGTDTAAKPLEYDTINNRVVYKGNHTPFEIKTDKNLSVAVGRDGGDTFWDKEVHINSTNNTIVFKQDNGHGDAFEKTLEATIPEGIYTKEALETAVRNAVNDLSARQGYGVRYEVSYDNVSQTYSIQDDGSHTGYIRTQFLWETGKDAYLNDIKASASVIPQDIGVSLLTPGALTLGTTDSENNSKPMRATWNQAEGKWHVTNNPGYTMPFSFSGTPTGVDIALNDGGIPDIRITLDSPAQDGDWVEFNIVPAKSDTSAGHEMGFSRSDLVLAPAVSDTPVPLAPLTITAQSNKIDFKEIPREGQGNKTGNLTAQIKAKDYASPSELALEVEAALETESRINGNWINYSVSWDEVTQKFTIKENGTRLSEFHLMWQTGVNAPTAQGGTGESIGSILGFNPDQDDVIKPVKSDRPAEWGIFNTLIDLKTYLSINDRDGIERTIGRLENNYDTMTSRIVDAGMKFSRLEVRETLTTNLRFSLTERRSMLEDADMIQTIMELKNLETAYQAALSSTARVLGLSLVDYLS